MQTTTRGKLLSDQTSTRTHDMRSLFHREGRYGMIWLWYTVCMTAEIYILSMLFEHIVYVLLEIREASLCSQLQLLRLMLKQFVLHQTSPCHTRRGIFVRVVGNSRQQSKRHCCCRLSIH